MSAIAEIMLSKGFAVFGSDAALSPITQRLESLGAQIQKEPAPSFVERCDLIIYTSAAKGDHPDIILAKKLGKKMISRAEALGILSRDKKTISVAGTHGKTTTTGMLSSILLAGKMDPTLHIGGILKEISSNLHIGKGEYLLTEACEYMDSFLTLKNYISVVLNIEEDHLDYFKNIKNIQNSFCKFTQNTSAKGVVVASENISHLLAEDRRIISFGESESADIQATNIYEHKAGRYAFTLVYFDKILGEIKLSAFGIHNVQNALAAIGAALFLGMTFDDVKNGLENYQGVARRMELLDETNRILLHDYAHHPTEIASTIKSCKEISNGKLIVVFQPHTVSRTRDLFDKFLNCFSGADEVWLLPIYPAREKAIKGVTSKKLMQALCKRGIDAKYFDSFDACEKEVRNSKADIIAFLGAGSIEQLAYKFKK